MKDLVQQSITKRNDGQLERAVLVGLVTPKQTEDQLDEYLDELAFLAKTAGAEVHKVYKQKLPHPNSRTFVGKGKLEEIREYAEVKEIDIVIFDDDLSPKQQAILEEELKCKVVDRSFLILDIFASRARTAQAKAQVELAQMQYLLPRLKGLWTHLERQRGGIGMRGPGEQEIETDRRIVNYRISLLKEQLKKIDRQQQTMRKRRGELIRVALVGYTNVGKSTIMNLLSKSEVFAEDKLFATLDTTVRKVVLNRMPFLLSDTVGFIRKLPHSLIESFKSTLDEVREADVLLHVVDISHAHFEDQVAVVDRTLKEILPEGDRKPVYMVFNKMDAYRASYFDEFLEQEVKTEIEEELIKKWETRTEGKCVFISALEKENVNRFREILTEVVSDQYQVRYPYKTHFF